MASSESYHAGETMIAGDIERKIQCRVGWIFVENTPKQR